MLFRSSAKNKCLSIFNNSVANDSWTKILASTLPSSLTEAETKNPSLGIKYLFINCFFHPQSVGGATRVFQDRVKALLDVTSPHDEVVVLCCDRSFASDTGTVVKYDWHGATVIQLNVEPKPWHYHYDSSVYRFCFDWFADQKFNFIEAHCLQLITSAPLLAASDHQIPYQVVVHDAWWISVNQFLVTPTGSPVRPELPASIDDRPPEVAAERKKDLYSILNSATNVFAVSSVFASVYESFGLQNIHFLFC